MLLWLFTSITEPHEFFHYWELSRASDRIESSIGNWKFVCATMNKWMNVECVSSKIKQNQQKSSELVNGNYMVAKKSRWFGIGNKKIYHFSSWNFIIIFIIIFVVIALCVLFRVLSRSTENRTRIRLANPPQTLWLSHTRNSIQHISDVEIYDDEVKFYFCLFSECLPAPNTAQIRDDVE